MKMPEGFTEHKGGAAPVSPDQFVETLIRTGNGFGSGGITRARYHLWEHKHHDKGIGAVVGYRLAQAGEQPALDVTARHRTVSKLPTAL